MRRSESGSLDIISEKCGQSGVTGNGGESGSFCVTGGNSGIIDVEYGNPDIPGGTCRILGVTGGVGAGKSTVLSYLKNHYGAYLLEADRIGHQVQQPGEPCYERIVAAFGDEILKEDGTIDRGRLGTIVYADREKMTRLNQIVHPAVKERIRSEIDRISRENAENPFVLFVIEAALLLEDHYDEICDEVWYIYADEQTREERLMQSRGYSREKVRQIFFNQMSEEEFRRRCPVVIDNSGGDLNDTCVQIDQALRFFAPVHGRMAD
ncbi:MAG: dephospho-CoA kinase [Lachnospiraceae bacterium]|nr:dephospho-CoA kinase [Lachnospiraceae bacterium]